MLSVTLHGQQAEDIRLLVSLERKDQPLIKGICTWLTFYVRHYYRTMAPNMREILKMRVPALNAHQVVLFQAKKGYPTPWNKQWPELEKWVRETAEGLGLSYSDFMRRFAQYWINRRRSHFRLPERRYYD